MSSNEDHDAAAVTAGALKDLLDSEGWKLLARHAADEWGDVGYGQRMKAAVRAIAQGPDRVYELARVAEQVDATKAALDEILNWPFQELQRLTPQTKRRMPFAGLRQGGTR